MEKAIYEIIEPEEDQDIVIRLIHHDKMSHYDLAMLNNEIAPHWHRSIEFSYIRKGRVNLWINNELHQLKAGDFIFVNSSQIHRLTTDIEEEGEVVLTILPYTTIKQFIPELDTIYFDFYGKHEYDPSFYEIFDFFYQHTQQPRPFDRLLINSYIFEILHILCTKYQSPNHDEFSRHIVRYQILNYIDTNYNCDLNLDHLSREFHFNPDYLSRRFKEVFGINFKSYLTHLRLQKAFHDLLNSDLTIQEIALKHGFSSAKTYIKSFKKEYNISPKQYQIQSRRRSIPHD